MHRLQTDLNTKDGKFAMQSGNLDSSIQGMRIVIQRPLHSSAMVSSPIYNVRDTSNRWISKTKKPSTVDSVSEIPPLPSYPESDATESCPPVLSSNGGVYGWLVGGPMM